MRSAIGGYAQQELDAAIAAGADETTQAMIFCQVRPTPREDMMPSGRPWPALTNTRRLTKAEVNECVERYRRWLEGGK